MAKRLWSILTDDMDHCIYTGTNRIERHHIFGGPNKSRSEKYGFIAPLALALHPNGVHAGQSAKIVDVALKQKCQKYFEEHYGTREEFIKEFGRSYL